MKPKTLLAIVLIAFLPEANWMLADESILRFQGEITQSHENGAQVIQRDFDCVLIDGPSDSFFIVLDSVDGCPWPDAYGTATNTAAGGVTPHLLYRFEGIPYTISLPDLKMSLPKDLKPTSHWTVGNWNWTVSEPFDDTAKNVNLIGTERRGRKQSATYDREHGWLAEAKLDVFMGRGEKFQLQLKRTSIDPVSSQHLQPLLDVRQTLLTLQRNLNRRPDSQRSDLTARQVQLAEAILPQLRSVPNDLPIQPLLDRIAQQVAAQSESVKAADSAKADMLGKTINNFALIQLNGRPFDATKLKGESTVLHFWSYTQKSLEEPYGQVAYLEFMKARNTTDGLNVIGVVTNPLIQSPENKKAELRSARQVAEFMNLSYPILYDDGQLQKQCDPTSAATNDSPVWIVLDATGRVVHYHQGFYEVDGKRGLKELADAIEAASTASE